MAIEPTDFILIFVTAGSEAEARAIARPLVADRLAACVKLAPVSSVYRWDGEVCEDSEWQLTIATRRASFVAVRDAVLARHSYDLPELVAVPLAAGTPEYLSWLRDSTAAAEV
ncbi:MAG: divalent-cation tolerance protein CutA [Geitlerinemataceae cyanobacterium]